MTIRNSNFVDVAVLTVVMVIAAASCCSGKPTGTQLRDIIQTILSDDTVWGDVLLERVRFDPADPKIQDLDVNYMTGMFSLENIDPLNAMQQLMRPTDYFTGPELTMSAYILDAATRCITFKRVAVHIVLTIRMLFLEPEKQEHLARVTMFAHVLPYFVNILSTIENSYVELIKLYDDIALTLTQFPDNLDKEQYEGNLKHHLENINTIIEGTCVNSDMKQYFRRLMLPTAEDPNLVNVITDNNISTHVDLNTIVMLLKENENAILDLYEQMDLLRHMDMGIWKYVLNYPDPPETFERSRTLSFRERMSNVLQRRPHHFMAIPVNTIQRNSQPIQFWPAASSSLV